MIESILHIEAHLHKNMCFCLTTYSHDFDMFSFIKMNISFIMFLSRSDINTFSASRFWLLGSASPLARVPSIPSRPAVATIRSPQVSFGHLTSECGLSHERLKPTSECGLSHESWHLNCRLRPPFDKRRFPYACLSAPSY